MVLRRQPFRFDYRTVKNKVTKFIVNETPSTYNDVVYPQIPFKIRSKIWRIKSAVDNTPAGQLYNLSFKVSELFRDERTVLNYNKAVEVRMQVERLIVEAMRHGDCHKPTMDLANYWLREKNLVHKLFKVFVPRYENYAGAFTALHMLGVDYERCGMTMTEYNNYKPKVTQNGRAVLEMRGNQLPPIIRPRLSRSQLLTNILIDGARENSSMKTTT